MQGNRLPLSGVIGTVGGMAPAATTTRAAGVGDAAAIGACHVRSWQAAYAGHFLQALLDGLDPQVRAAGWRRYLERDDHEREALLVVETEEGVVGFASVGLCRDPSRPGRARCTPSTCWPSGGDTATDGD